MFFLEKIKQTARDESGAVTVDWVMLTAATIGMVLAMSATIEGGFASIAADINDAMRLENVQSGIGASED